MKKKRENIGLNPENLTNEQLQAMVKNICAGCQKSFDNSIKNYLQSGNFCKECNSKINEMAKDKGMIKKMKLTLGLTD